MWRSSAGTSLGSAKEIPGRTHVPGRGRSVVPGNSGLEISTGQMGRPDPRDQGWQQTWLHLVIIISR